MTTANAVEQRFERTLGQIALEITADWDAPNYGAVPYINAMMSMKGMGDVYGADSARSIVAYFLSNATTWRGPVARRVKHELKKMLERSAPPRAAGSANYGRY